MEGIALSAATLLALTIPGLLTYYSYLRTSASWEVSGSNEALTPQILIAATMGSLLFHTVWGYMLHKTPYPVDYPAVLSILREDGNALARITDDYVFVFQATAYLYSQCLVAWIAGKVLAWAASGGLIGWRKQIALTSNGAVWHKLLRYPANQATGFDGPILTVTHTEGDETYVYSGLLDEYQLDSTGKLVRLVLRATFRRHFPHENHHAEDFYDPEAWVQMRGERFVINCENVVTIEVDYIWLKKDDEAASESTASDDKQPVVIG